MIEWNDGKLMIDIFSLLVSICALIVAWIAKNEPKTKEKLQLLTKFDEWKDDTNKNIKKMDGVITPENVDKPNHTIYVDHIPWKHGSKGNGYGGRMYIRAMQCFQAWKWQELHKQMKFSQTFKSHELRSLNNQALVHLRECVFKFGHLVITDDDWADPTRFSPI